MLYTYHSKEVYMANVLPKADVRGNCSTYTPSYRWGVYLTAKFQWPRSRVVYRICSIRHRGYYLFHHAVMCGFYSRAAIDREQHLLDSVLSVKKKELRCVDLVLKQTFQLLDQPPLCYKYKAVPTRHIQSVSLFSSLNNLHIDCPLCLKNYQTLASFPGHSQILSCSCGENPIFLHGCEIKSAWE